MSSNDSDKTTDTSNNTSSSSSSGKGIGDIDLTKIVTTFTSSATNSDFQVDCGTLYEGFSRCMSPGEQLTNIHRYGQAQDCSIFFDDWKKCLYSRMTNDKQKIKVRKSAALLLVLPSYI